MDSRPWGVVTLGLSFSGFYAVFSGFYAVFSGFYVVFIHLERK